ncbi:hypothetical protein B7463_g5632, partial [Scytalidium lignicola]
MELDPIKAIRDSRPPASDYLTYLTILESHLSKKILPELNEILQDEELTQNIGWDLIHLLLPMRGSEECLSTIARLGNPREVVLKVTEALQLLPSDATEDEEEKDEALNQDNDKVDTAEEENDEPTNTEKFCKLVALLSILLPRIRTKYPSRFLSTSLIAILRAYQPSAQATLSVIAFVHSLSGIKRPQLPSRKSGTDLQTTTSAIGDTSGVRAPDPEAQEEDPREAAIQKKLLQSFITYILEDYANENQIEWASRLLEFFNPAKVVAGRKSLAEAFKEDSNLQIRDTVVGQLVALARDLELLNYDILFDTIYKPESEPDSENDEEEHYPSSPEDIPLSAVGCLFLIMSMVFSSILFDSKGALPDLSIFPDHEKLVKRFIGTAGAQNIGTEPVGIIDAVAAIGIWLEHNNKFVSGPLEDDDFLQHLQSLSLLSANTPLPTLRYACSVLTSSILHAHPDDRVRLAFISDTLEHCPYETLKESAIGLLKDELMTAQTRKSNNVFSSSAAITAVLPYFFPEIPSVESYSNEELIQEIMQAYPFHMGVLNFLYFLSGKVYSHLVPGGMIQTSKELYLIPLQEVLEKCLKELRQERPSDDSGENVGQAEIHLLGERLSQTSTQAELQLLGDRLALYFTRIEDL